MTRNYSPEKTINGTFGELWVDDFTLQKSQDLKQR